MLQRKIYEKMLQWKRNRPKTCLFVKGARQVGKSYIIRRFGETEYAHYVEINFLKNPELKSIFVGDLAADEIYMRMTAHIPGITLEKGKTLVFLDEIQTCGEARTALKFLAEDKRYDVIASGSLLGLAFGSDADGEVRAPASVPVGYEESLTMHSLDFEEFLWGRGFGGNAVDYLRRFFERKERVSDALNEKYERLFREYMVVGGMPEVVEDFCANLDFGRVQNLQEKILGSYRDDISAHAKTPEKIKVRACYDSIPRQLARENRKFKYSEVEHNATAKKYYDSIEWLKNTNLVNICRNVRKPCLPLMANVKENEFKVYLNDTGLLMAMYGMNAKLALLEDSLKGNAKGGIYENAIAEALAKKGYALNYYKTPDSRTEIEFVIEKGGAVIPLEVKSGNAATASLNGFLEKFHPPIAYKIIKGNLGLSGNKFTFPHYMTLFL